MAPKKRLLRWVLIVAVTTVLGISSGAVGGKRILRVVGLGVLQLLAQLLPRLYCDCRLPKLSAVAPSGAIRAIFQ